MSTITLCCEFKNEVENVVPVFETFADIVEEIIVLDTGSTDGTQELCRSLGAKVFQVYIPDPYLMPKYEKGTMGYGEMRTLHVNLVKTDWGFIFDGDERMDKDHVIRLKQLADEKKEEGYDVIAIPRQHYRAWDMSVCENPDIKQYADWQYRFVRCAPDYNIYWVRKVHEQIKGVRKVYKAFDNPVIRHFGYLKTDERIKFVAEVCDRLHKIDDSFYKEEPYKEKTKDYWTTKRNLDIEQKLRKPYEVYVVGELLRLEKDSYRKKMFDINNVNIRHVAQTTTKTITKDELKEFCKGLSFSELRKVTQDLSNFRGNNVFETLNSYLNWKEEKIPVDKIYTSQAERTIKPLFESHNFKLVDITNDKSLFETKPYCKYPRDRKVTYKTLLAVKENDDCYRLIDGVHRAIQLVRQDKKYIQLCFPV